MEKERSVRLIVSRRLPLPMEAFSTMSTRSRIAKTTLYSSTYNKAVSVEP